MHRGDGFHAEAETMSRDPTAPAPTNTHGSTRLARDRDGEQPRGDHIHHAAAVDPSRSGERGRVLKRCSPHSDRHTTATRCERVSDSPASTPLTQAMHTSTNERRTVTAERIFHTTDEASEMGGQKPNRTERIGRGRGEMMLRWTQTDEETDGARCRRTLEETFVNCRRSGV
jgi:hypothetical protein